MSPRPWTWSVSLLGAVICWILSATAEVERAPWVAVALLVVAVGLGVWCVRVSWTSVGPLAGTGWGVRLAVGRALRRGHADDPRIAGLARSQATATVRVGAVSRYLLLVVGFLNLLTAVLQAVASPARWPVWCPLLVGSVLLIWFAVLSVVWRRRAVRYLG